MLLREVDNDRHIFDRQEIRCNIANKSSIDYLHADKFSNDHYRDHHPRSKKIVEITINEIQKITIRSATS